MSDSSFDIRDSDGDSSDRDNDTGDAYYEKFYLIIDIAVREKILPVRTLATLALTDRNFYWCVSRSLSKYKSLHSKYKSKFASRLYSRLLGCKIKYDRRMYSMQKMEDLLSHPIFGSQIFDTMKTPFTDQFLRYYRVAISNVILWCHRRADMVATIFINGEAIYITNITKDMFIDMGVTTTPYSDTMAMHMESYSHETPISYVEKKISIGGLTVPAKKLDEELPTITLSERPENATSGLYYVNLMLPCRYNPILLGPPLVDPSGVRIALNTHVLYADDNSVGFTNDIACWIDYVNRVVVEYYAVKEGSYDWNKYALVSSGINSLKTRSLVREISDINYDYDVASDATICGMCVMDEN